jgi:hypothetical protein
VLEESKSERRGEVREDVGRKEESAGVGDELGRS